MQPVAAFSEAWRRNDADIADWIERHRRLRGRFSQEEVFAMGDILADMADYVRVKMDGFDDAETERIVMRGTDNLRTAMMTGNHLAAQKAWSLVGQQAQVALEDSRHRDVRDDRMEALRAAGFTEYRWKARLDRRCCAYCAVRHGSLHPIGEPMVSHPNCRCVPVPPTTKLVNGVDWLRARSPFTLKRILGKRRAEMVVEEGWDPAAMVDTDRARLIPLRDLNQRDSLMRSKDESFVVRTEYPARTPEAVMKRYQGKQVLGALDEWQLSMGAERELIRTGFEERVRPTELHKRKRKPELHLEGSRLTAEEADYAVEWVNNEGMAILDDLMSTFNYGTTWNGRIDIIDPREPHVRDGVHGVKIWNCSLYLNPDLFRNAAAGRPDGEAMLFHTTYHEFLHSFSRSYTRGNFAENRWLEEGTVDLMTHIWGGELYENLYDEGKRLWAEHLVHHGGHIYNGAIDRLRLIAELTDDDIEVMGPALMATPMNERYGVLKNAILEAPESVSDADVARALEVLEELRRGSWLRGYF